MKKVTFLLPCFLAAGLLLAACSSHSVTANTEPGSAAAISSEASLSSAVSSATAPADSAASQISQAASSKALENSEILSETGDMVQKVKEYLLHGQNDKPEADKLKWSETFLNQVDIDAVYRQYLSSGGKADDVERFAEYLTQNAPVPDNWKALFEADLMKSYGVKASRYTLIQDDLYQVYVNMDGTEVPYVAVNPRTGYYHG